MAKTITQCLVDGLLASGYIELTSKSRKYRTFAYREAPEGSRYFVGKAAGLRYGNIVSASLPASTKIRDTLIKLGSGS